MLRHRIARGVMAAVVAVALTLGAANLASAEPLVQPADSTTTLPTDAAGLLARDTSNSISQHDIDTLHEGIWEVFEAKLAQGEVTYTVLASGNHLYQTDVVLEDGQIVQFYHETSPHSSEALSLAEAVEHDPSRFRSGGNEWYPKIWSGTDSTGRWVRFNRAAQGLMVGAAGTALKVAICAIPGVNAVGCAVVWGATLVAKQVIKKIGRCPTSRPWLYAYPGNIGASNCRA